MSFVLIIQLCNLLVDKGNCLVELHNNFLISQGYSKRQPIPTTPSRIILEEETNQEPDMDMDDIPDDGNEGESPISGAEAQPIGDDDNAQ